MNIHVKKDVDQREWKIQKEIVFKITTHKNIIQDMNVLNSFHT